MKRIFFASMIVLTLSFLAFGSIVWAGPVAPVRPTHSTQSCFQRNGDFYCSWTEETHVNKFVPGARGQWEWRFVPTNELKTEKCAEGVHQSS